MDWSNHWRRDARIPFELLQNEFRRFVEEYFQPGVGPGPGGERRPRPEPGEGRPWTPPVDVYETPEETVVVAEIPGVDASQVELSISNSVLVIRGTKTVDAPAEAHAQIQERRHGTFLRHVPISSEVDFDAAQAETTHGVLTIRLPRKKVAPPRTIPVRTG
jgi:HSP20 family protein